MQANEVHVKTSEGGFTKKSLEELAVFGGPQLFGSLLHVGRPNVPDQSLLLQRMQDVVESRWLTNDGPQVQEFERRIARAAGASHCVAMCNGTVALQIAIRAAGLSGEVIIPSFTFVATAHALQWQQITPIFCDIDETYCLNPERVEELITPRTTGIIGVHLWGRTCNSEALAAICKRNSLTLMFDAAHAFGCSRKGVMVGNFGRAEVLSFHATKFLNTLEGEAIVTNDPVFADACRAMRNFGFSGEDEVANLGINGKMNEIEAVMGLTSLDQIDDIIATNKRNYSEYEKQLRNIPGLTLLSYDENEMNNFQYVVIEIAGNAAVSRDSLHTLLTAEGVLARRYFHPGCHNMEPYRTLQPDSSTRLPRTERACASMLCLPTGTTVGIEQIRTICAFVRFAIQNGHEITARITHQLNVPTASESIR